MIGGAVLVASGCYIILRERQRRGPAAAAAGVTVTVNLIRG